MESADSVKTEETSEDEATDMDSSLSESKKRHRPAGPRNAVKENAAMEDQDENGIEIFVSRDSILSLKELKLIIQQYRVPAHHRLVLAGPGNRACYPPAGYIAISARHFEAGLRLPIAPFFKRVINAIGLSPFQLNPNSYRYLTWLYLLCKSSGRPAPSTLLLKSLFLLKDSGPFYNSGIYALCARRGSEHRKLFPPFPPRTAPYIDEFFFAGGNALVGINNFNFAKRPAKWNRPHKLPYRDEETLRILLGLSSAERRRRTDQTEVRLIRYKLAPGPLGMVEFDEQELSDPEEHNNEAADKVAEVGETEKANEREKPSSVKEAGIIVQKMSGRPLLKYNIGDVSQPRPQREEPSSRQVVQPDGGDRPPAPGRVPSMQVGIRRDRDEDPQEESCKKHQAATSQGKGKNPVADTHWKQSQQQEEGGSSPACALWAEFSNAVTATPSKELFSHMMSATGSRLSQLISDHIRGAAVLSFKQAQEVQELEKTVSCLQSGFAEDQKELGLLKNKKASLESSLEAAKKELEEMKIAFDDERAKTSRALTEVGKLWTVFGQSQTEAVSWQEKSNKYEAELHKAEVTTNQLKSELSEERSYLKEAVEKANTAVEWVVGEMFSHFPELDYSFNSDFAKICKGLSEAKPVFKTETVAVPGQEGTDRGPRVDGAQM